MGRKVSNCVGLLVGDSVLRFPLVGPCVSSLDGDDVGETVVGFKVGATVKPRFRMGN